MNKLHNFAFFQRQPVNAVFRTRPQTAFGIENQQIQVLRSQSLWRFDRFKNQVVAWSIYKKPFTFRRDPAAARSI
ncbi:MAG: hypothetical protein IPH31_10380 [Lewinellaceae bacterium]|nr:hypothetical protein [Lewinellaceae bacterium]